jgi:hypothetical protein
MQSDEKANLPTTALAESTAARAGRFIENQNLGVQSTPAESLSAAKLGYYEKPKEPTKTTTERELELAGYTPEQRKQVWDKKLLPAQLTPEDKILKTARVLSAELVTRKIREWKEAEGDPKKLEAWKRKWSNAAGPKDTFNPLTVSNKVKNIEDNMYKLLNPISGGAGSVMGYSEILKDYEKRKSTLEPDVVTNFESLKKVHDNLNSQIQSELNKSNEADYGSQLEDLYQQIIDARNAGESDEEINNDLESQGTSIDEIERRLNQ